MLPILNIHHNVNFSFSFLDYEGASQSQALIGVVTFKSVSQRRHKAVASSSLLGSHLYDLEWHTSEEASLPMTVPLLMFIQS